MPNCSCVEFSTCPAWATHVTRLYSGWPPIWYGHQTLGRAIRSAG